LLSSAFNPKISSIKAASWDSVKKSGNRGINACTELKPVAYTTYKTNESSQMSPTVEEVRVDMADMKAEIKPVELVTSVGSCVAICLYDSKYKCGGVGSYHASKLCHCSKRASSIKICRHGGSSLSKTYAKNQWSSIEAFSKNRWRR